MVDFGRLGIVEYVHQSIGHMEYSAYCNSGISDHSVLTRILCFVALFISVFNCTLHSANKKFTYKGIVYEVYGRSDNVTCATAGHCCDFTSEYTADGNIEIPEEVYDENDVKYMVTRIGDRSFSMESKLKSIRLPKTIHSIDLLAFDWCDSLKSIDFPQNLEYINYGAFMNCESLESLVIPDSVHYIDDAAFSDCISLRSVKLPDGLIYLSPSVFLNCTSLETVEFGESLKCIYGWSHPSEMSEEYPTPGPFYGCTSLRCLKFPDSLEEMKSEAIQKCPSLETVVLSRNLKKMEGNALNCPSLREVIYPVSDPQELPLDVREGYDEFEHDEYYRYELGYGFLDETYEKATLKVGLGGLEKAHQTVPWKFFKNIEEVDFSGVDEIGLDSSDSASDGVYRMDGVRVGNRADGLPSGLYIVREGVKTSKVMVP